MDINIPSGIALRLKSRFGERYTVYVDRQDQNVEEDAFYVLTTISLMEDIGDRVWLHSLVTIRATQVKSERFPRRSLSQLGVDMVEALRKVPINASGHDLAHTKDLQCEFVDDENLIVTFSLDFSIFMTEKELADFIRTFAVNINTKQGE
jgi:hypothetical protein